MNDRRSISCEARVTFRFVLCPVCCHSRAVLGRPERLPTSRGRLSKLVLLRPHKEPACSFEIKKSAEKNLSFCLVYSICGSIDVSQLSVE